MTRRLLLSYLALTVVVLAMLEVPLGIFYAQRERDRFINDVEQQANIMATSFEDDLERGTTPDPSTADAYERLHDARVVVVDERGTSVVDTAARVGRDFSTRPEISTALQGDQASGIHSAETLDRSVVYAAVPIASGGTVHGALRITIDATRVDERVRAFWLALAAIAVIITGVAALIGWALARSFARPVQRLSETAARFAHGDLSPPQEAPTGPVELRDLAETLATMAERLDALIGEQRAFVADASHQLRTPLTALRLRLENLQTRIAPEDAPELDAILDESSRLAALVNDLLQLARADQSAAPAEVELVALATERVDMWSAIADAKGITVDLVAPVGPVRATAVPGAVEQVLDNLLDNAIVASHPDATVTVSIVSGRADHRLAVLDHGRGLTDADKRRATRRFWRGDTSTPGTGLGLAIAAALASASAGRLDLTDTDGGGLTVTLQVPAASRRHSSS